MAGWPHHCCLGRICRWNGNWFLPLMPCHAQDGGLQQLWWALMQLLLPLIGFLIIITCANKCAFPLEYALVYAMQRVIEFMITLWYKNWQLISLPCYYNFLGYWPCLPRQSLALSLGISLLGIPQNMNVPFKVIMSSTHLYHLMKLVLIFGCHLWLISLFLM